ncbi:integral membrane protein [Campylobacter hyointestinalis]|uniref:Integral membrane protein n=1 Tax=Campylobacter hyointestinalis subsp. hyointestinalis TaxID=91352 RepID=A0A0S4R1W8_CAMHY|nr:Fe-S-containing protein [Campylobacter hyointestinalis]CUU68009.1 integral membrane protein [Campylobacter hyointestinalis subsp. hyointestinalis]CUU68082.1 integral membrane protein [Campylobacter hyointestinalis]CUU82239.1 integral membrane protein [Campylobacter hyointestinalis subsp. hyointestinalis]CUU86169.1 integral membrane protein [Campylobacter hyointestinalis subsp. hyointestinalis]CUU87313.1 integral membrane protein [Campylobacter hyointestinalis subsp. hyointestinalis]
MTVFFYQVVLALFGPSFILAFIDHEKHIKNILLPSIFGLCFGLFVFGLFKISINTDSGKIIFDTLCIIMLLLTPVCIKFKSSYFSNVFSFFLAFGYGYEYGFISMNFMVFAGDLLDSLSLSNLFMVSLALLSLISVYFVSRAILKNTPNLFRYIFLYILVILCLADRVSFLTLSLMQDGLVGAYSNLLSVVAKTIYFNSFLPVVLSILFMLLALVHLFWLPKKIGKKDIVLYRINIAKRTAYFRAVIFCFLTCFLISFFSLFYLLVSSKPPKISEPTLVEPVRGEFKFDANLVMDSKLHRFAYITDDGHEVRFFLVNRFKDKLAPVAVFDACAICGDMGYIKSGDNLICISCNVRIFLPSVGKPGGCNPIPFEYKFDGKEISINLKTIEKGATFFSKIVKKEVTDPVSKNKILNDSKFTYVYYGRTYFFEDEKNQAEFEAYPENYVTTDGLLKENK